MSTARIRLIIAAFAFTCMTAPALVSRAQDATNDTKKPAAAKDDAPAKPDAPKADSGDTKKPPTADDVIKNLLKERKDPPTVEPTTRPSDNRPPSTSPQLDPRVLGTAPDGPAPTLRREGEFVIARRGRLVRASSSTGLGQSLFVFDADAKEAADPPVFVMPCQMLQSMETLVQERGDQVRFIISGQVFVYRGANYMLPTMMKLSVDRGNLEK